MFLTINNLYAYLLKGNIGNKIVHLSSNIFTAKTYFYRNLQDSELIN